jgi:hypothetical protein
VIWQHFRAFVWLRWRLAVNQWRRGGAFNAVLMIVIAVAALVTMIPLFIGSFALGAYLIPQADPVYLMWAWDVLIIVFLFFWFIGLITELQRTEPLSLSKFMHLPVTVTGAFLINYFSSVLRLSVIFFGPIMLGFGLALVYTKGLPMVIPFLSLGALLLMVTALTYQFQGWLASLMSNPRRRRTVVVVTTMAFILVSQVPNMINMSVSQGTFKQFEKMSRDQVEATQKLTMEFQTKAISFEEYQRRVKDVDAAHKSARQAASRAMFEKWERITRLANLAVPVGWLPVSVRYAAEGQVLPSLLALLGMSAIGAASLWRAYRTTLGIYQARFTSATPKPVRAPPRVTTANAAKPAKEGDRFLETRIPGLSEPVSVIALAGVRALLRAPEAKMMLLTPLIFTFIFGPAVWRQRSDFPELVRPLIAIGGMLMLLLGLLPMMCNQFGFDRDGFRVFVLSSASRRDILMGKNLAFAPLVLGAGAVLLVLMQAVSPLRWDHFLGTIPQYVSMFLMFCIFTNLSSIYTPMYVAAGTLKSANVKASTILVQLVMFMVIFPLTQGITLLPLGIEALVRFLGWPAGVPTYLVLSFVQCAVVIFIYHSVLLWQGNLFRTRELKILDVVTSRA